MGLDRPVTPLAGLADVRLLPEEDDDLGVPLPLPFVLREETATCCDPSIGADLMDTSGTS